MSVKELNLNLDVGAGTSIEDAARGALTISKKRKLPVQFAFNGILVRGDWRDDVQDLINQWDRGNMKRQLRVGDGA